MQMWAGEKVGRPGVYRIVHRNHRPAHYSILRQGEILPGCRVCGSSVRFEFAQRLNESDELEHVGYDRDFMDAVLGVKSAS
jgi:hypothetical protein